MEVRESVDLYFDTGDCIKTGNLGIPLKPEPVWELLTKARCTASVIGNRETHVLESVFQAKLAGSSQPVLCANMHRRDGSSPLDATTVCHADGLRIGVIGLSVPMVTSKMRTQAASAFLWDQPESVAMVLVNVLRPKVEILIALTHIGLTQDRKLAESCPELDVIFGGHSHSVLESPERVGRTWICQGGSHGRFVGLYQLEDGKLSGGLVPWGAALS